MYSQHSRHTTGGVLVSFILFLSLAASPLQAADPFVRIFGQVTDSTGAALPEASVEIINVDTGVVQTLTTTTEGTFNAPRLTPGTYTVKFSKADFRSLERAGFELGAGATAEANAALEVGAVTTAVTVEEDPVLVDTTSGIVRQSLETRLVDRMPLLGRDSNYLLRVIPGAVQTETSGGDLAPNFSVLGSRDTSNLFSLNGSDNGDSFNSKSNRTPPPDAIAELVVQRNFSAEYGRGSGAAVLTLTKSGTNQFHGSVYNYLQNDNLNANSFERNATERERPEFKQNQFGGTIGGPVWRNHTFFFFNYQRLFSPGDPYTYRKGGLTQAELAGDFSNSAVIPVVTATAAAAPNSPFAGMEGQQITDLSPYINPTIRSWYDTLDLPVVSNSGELLFEDRVQKIDEPEYTLRLDHSLWNNSQLAFTYFRRAEDPNLRHIDGAPESSTWADKIVSRNIIGSLTTSFGSSMVNEFRIGHNKIDQGRKNSHELADFSALGFAYPQQDPGAFLDVDPLAPSEFGFSYLAAVREDRSLYDVRDTFSLVQGSHYMKAGVNYQQHDVLARHSGNNGIGFRGDYLGNQAAEWLIGWPRNLVLTTPFARPSRKNVFHLFFQDDWKVSPRLSLNLGLRWEPQFWAYVSDDQALIFDPAKTSSQFDNFPAGVLLSTDPQLPNRSGLDHDWNNFAPRLGAAYRLDGAGKNVLRFGWGLFYDVLDSANRDGIGTATRFPFDHFYIIRFNQGFPERSFLDPFGYLNQATPDLFSPLDPATAEFDPLTSYGSFVPDNSLGYTHQWNVTFEHALSPAWAASAGWIGNRGVGLAAPAYWNVPGRIDGSDNWDSENLAARRPIQQFRYQTRQYNAAIGSSRYDAAQFTLRGRGEDLVVLASYTFSRYLADVDGLWADQQTRSDPFDLGVDWARSRADRPHNLQINISYDLPFFRSSTGLARTLLGGWSATTFLQAQSGQPVNVLAAQNNTFTCEGCAVRPDATGAPLINSGWRDDADLVYLNENAFAQPADGTFGNLERNAVRWPSRTNVDFNVMKSFPLYRERVRMDLKFDFFNLFNNVNFVPPTVVELSSPVTLSMRNAWTEAPRRIQIGTRITF